MNTAMFQPLEIGNGKVEVTTQHIQLTMFADNSQAYHDAQVSDYMGLKRRNFPNRAPLKLSLRAHVSLSAEQLVGTLGFGFWNQPFVPDITDFRLPRATWFFFAAPPNHMTLAKGSSGHGFKVATIDATRPLFFALAPFAPIGFLLMRVPQLYRLLWPIGQWSIGVAEKELEVNISESHLYELHWLKDQVQFYVDEDLVFTSPYSPRGPLGFIAWIDNQYAIVTPQGQFGFGKSEVSQPQSLTISELKISSL